MTEPSRGEIWVVGLDPVRGHQQGGRRPALVLSADAFNHGPADLVVVVPITTKDKGIPLHVRVDRPEGGIRAVSFIKCEDIRSLSKQRLVERWGRVSAAVLQDVEDRIAILLNLRTNR
jgi:mRNA interferase MazF